MRVRTVLGGAAAAALALTAAPAVAVGEAVDTEPAVLAPCEATAGAAVLSPGVTTGTVTTPSFLVGNERESVAFVVDLAGEPVGSTARLTGVLTWGVAANDYDLELAAGNQVVTTDGYQPVEPPEEMASLSRVAHCELVELTAIDFLAPVVVDTVAYDLRASVRPPS